jgi:hypothetical protein
VSLFAIALCAQKSTLQKLPINRALTITVLHIFSRKNMKVYISTLVILLSGCAITETHEPKEEFVIPKTLEPVEVETKVEKIINIESIITNQALMSYKGKYLKASTHKAFVQSESGAWNWRSNRTSKEHAINSALISCQADNKKYEEMYPCKVINVDGEWANK